MISNELSSEGSPVVASIAGDDGGGLMLKPIFTLSARGFTTLQSLLLPDTVMAAVGDGGVVTGGDG